MRSNNRLPILLFVAGLLLAILLAANLLRGCGGPDSSLKSDRAEDRIEAIDRLADEGSARAEAIARAIQDPDPRVAARAVLALGRVGGTSQAPVLAQAGTDQREVVREAAVTAMGLMGEADQAGALRRTLATDPSSKVRAAAARALGRMRHLESSPALIEALEDESEDVRRLAYASIRRLWGFDFAFDAGGTLAEREKTLRFIRTYWDQLRGARRYEELKAYHAARRQENLR